MVGSHPSPPRPAQSPSPDDPMDGASTHTSNLWCPSLIPTNSDPMSATINSLLFPRSLPLSQAYQDGSTGSGCTQRLPVWDLFLSQLEAHEHGAAGKPQLGVKVDRALHLCLAPQGGLEERGIQFCLEIHGKASPGREKHVGSGHRATACTGHQITP